MPFKDPAIRKAKQAEYSRRWYQKNTEKQKQVVKAWKQRNKAWWYEYKATLVCWHCGENSPECIDLHHVIASGKKSNKDTAAYWATQQGLKREAVLKLIEESCVPLCANCHRKVHAMHKRILREQQQAQNSSILDAEILGVTDD